MWVKIPPPGASAIDAMTEEEAKEFRKGQARARYIAKLSLQRNPLHPSEADQHKLGQILEHRHSIAEDLAEWNGVRYSCAGDVRQMLKAALRRDVKFYGRGLGVVDGYSASQIKKILGQGGK